MTNLFQIVIDVGHDFENNNLGLGNISNGYATTFAADENSCRMKMFPFSLA